MMTAITTQPEIDMARRKTSGRKQGRSKRALKKAAGGARARAADAGRTQPGWQNLNMRKDALADVEALAAKLTARLGVPVAKHQAVAIAVKAALEREDAGG